MLQTALCGLLSVSNHQKVVCLMWEKIQKRKIRPLSDLKVVFVGESSVMMAALIESYFQVT